MTRVDSYLALPAVFGQAFCLLSVQALKRTLRPSTPCPPGRVKSRTRWNTLCIRGQAPAKR